MLETIWQTLRHTPWWVYLILYYCIRVGIRASRTSIVPVWKVVIIPLVFLSMSGHTLFTSFTLTTFVWACYLGGLLAGMLLGALQGYYQRISVDRTHYLLEIPGTWTTMIIIALIFISKYYFGYRLGSDPALAHQPSFELPMLLVMGATSGLFVGRVLFYFYRLYRSESVDLSHKKPGRG